MPEREEEHAHVIDSAIKRYELRVSEAEARRQRVVKSASRIIDVLEGKEPDVQPLTEIIAPNLASAPLVIPTVRLKRPFLDERDQVGWGDSDLGYYYVRRFRNERLADTFNTGFYAGVLASKKGLVDPEQFKTDRELEAPQQDNPDGEQSS